MWRFDGLSHFYTVIKSLLYFNLFDLPTNLKIIRIDVIISILQLKTGL